MKKQVMHSYLVAAGLLVLLITGCGSRHSAAFEQASAYWRGLKGPGHIDASVLATLIQPMFNQRGIQYLIDKMERGTEEESEIAVLCLVPIYEILLDVPSEESRQLRKPIEKSRLFELAAVYATNGSNEAIRDTLTAFVKRDTKEAATSREIPVSGAETWDIAGRTYKIHHTHIDMRQPKGPMFTVVLDQSRSSISKMIDPVTEIPPKKAIAKYAFDNGYFGKAQEIQLAGEKIKLQNRISVWVGQATRDGFGAVNIPDGEYSLQDLGIPAKEGTANNTSDGIRRPADGSPKPSM